METIQPHEREALLVQLAKPRRRAPEPRPTRPEYRKAAVQELLDLAASVDVANLPFRHAPSRRRWRHVSNCRHTTYHLTCAEFEMLEQESYGFCDICGRDLAEARYPLEIDHDHAIGWRAVRGLICRSCNGQVAAVEAGRRAPSRAMQFYLADPWYFRVGLEPLVCPVACNLFAHRAVR